MVTLWPAVSHSMAAAASNEVPVSVATIGNADSRNFSLLHLRFERHHIFKNVFLLSVSILNKMAKHLILAKSAEEAEECAETDFDDAERNLNQADIGLMRGKFYIKQAKKDFTDFKALTAAKVDGLARQVSGLARKVAKLEAEKDLLAIVLAKVASAKEELAKELAEVKTLVESA